MFRTTPISGIDERAPSVFTPRRIYLRIDSAVALAVADAGESVIRRSAEVWKRCIRFWLIDSLRRHMHTQKIAAYKIVSHEDISEVETIVTAYLEEGYELYGSPFCSTARYCQAIVRHNESNVDGTSK